MKTHSEIVAELTTWAANYNAVKEAFDGAGRYFSVENPFSESVWPLFEAYTDLVAESAGDHADTLQWYCYENEMGKKAYGARPSNKHLMRPIRNLDDLAQLILDAQS